MKKKNRCLQLSFFYLYAMFVLIGSPAIAQSLDDIVDSHNSANQPLTREIVDEPDVPRIGQPETDAQTSVKDMRRKIVELAEGMVGKVHNKAGDDGYKIGWQHLKEFYEVAYKVDDLEKERSWWLKDIKGVGKKVNDWCGIFGVWAWRKSGLAVHWNTRLIGCPYRGKKDLLGAGDIVILKLSVNKYNHHCIVKSIDGEKIVTIDGNQGIDSIKLTNRKISDIEIFYSVSEALEGNPPAATPAATNGLTSKPASNGTPANQNPKTGQTNTGNQGKPSAVGSPTHTDATPINEKEISDLLQQIFNLVRVVIGPFC